MKRLLVLVALELEARTLARELGLRAVPGAAWPHHRTGALEIACVGLRGAHMDRRLDACDSPDVVVSAGVCGALSPSLREGALVVPETVIAGDGDRVPTAVLPALTRRGSLLCPRTLVETPSEKARLWIETGAIAVDLESGPIAAWARARALPFAVVRAVSDTASESVPAELAAAVASDGTVNAARAVRAALGRPRVIGRALTLRRGTSAALSTVARALATLARAEARA